MSSAPAPAGSQSWFQRFLTVIERVGNEVRSVLSVLRQQPALDVGLREVGSPA